MTLYKADITVCGVNTILCRLVHKSIVVLLLILLIDNTVLAIGDTFDTNLMQQSNMAVNYNIKYKLPGVKIHTTQQRLYIPPG